MYQRLVSGHFRKTVKTGIMLFLFLLNYPVTSQIVVSSETVDADISTILEINSSNKGLLIPRMTNTQIQLIANPVDGLIVYSTDDKVLYCYISGENEWQNLNLGSDEIIPNAIFSVGTGSSCDNTTKNGPYNAGVALIEPNYISIEVSFSTSGNWEICSDTINGYWFIGNGTVSTTGIHQLTLYGYGTPIYSQSDNFTVTGNNSSGSCSVSVSVESAPTYPSGAIYCNGGFSDVQNVYNPVTGKIWMDRNLGASRVATSVDDSEAFGDLFQWGRLSDGHQCRNSGTTTSLSSTNAPGHDNFILSPSAYYDNDWRNPQNPALWQGESGINNPCPSGYRIPTAAEWDAEIATWTGTAYSSELKLVKAGFRQYDDGIVTGEDTHGYYWSSTVLDLGSGFSSYHATYLSIGFSGSTQTGGLNAYGYSVRCIKE